MFFKCRAESQKILFSYLVFLSQQKHKGVVRYVIPGPLKKPTDIERKPKVLKSPLIKTDLTTILPKLQISQTHFHSEAYSWGQTYVCFGLIKPSLGTNMWTCIPAFFSCKASFGRFFLTPTPSPKHPHTKINFF